VANERENKCDEQTFFLNQKWLPAEYYYSIGDLVFMLSEVQRLKILMWEEIKDL